MFSLILLKNIQCSIFDVSEETSSTDKIKACYYQNKFILVHINSFIKHHAVKAYGEIGV
jgi:hypothetical protein